MIKNNDNDFDNNYVSVSITSAMIFSLYFISGIFILNLTYLPQAIRSNGILGIFIVLSYYILTSIALLPVIIVINTVLGLIVKKAVKYIYYQQRTLGFILYPLVMTLIPFFMIHSVVTYVGKISSFDYYFLYFLTWIAALLQYVWLLKNINEQPETINQKQADFIKNLDNIDYF